jgi:hypothetical protein
LVIVLVEQLDQAMPEPLGNGPAAVCGQAIAAAAQAFGTSPEAIVGSERSRTVSDARAVAMTVARQSGLSFPAIAEQFNKDHGSVIHAVRRTSQRPRLQDAAVRIPEQLERRFSAALPRPESPRTTAPAAPPDSVPAFEPSGILGHAVAAAAKEFGTSPQALLGPDRSRAASDARAVAMAAARMLGQSLPRIARHFDGDHTAVLHATRRVEKNPLLAALAAEIAADLPEDAVDREPAAAETNWGQVTPVPFRGAGEARRAGEARPGRAADLRVAR